MLSNEAKVFMACPLCREKLAVGNERFVCARCQRDFLASDGVVSFLTEEIFNENPLLREEIACQNNCLRVYENEKSLVHYFEKFDLESLSHSIEKASSIILDIGCGTGGLGDFVNGKIYGIDVSPVLLRQARNREYCVYQASANHLPFASNSFDVVFMRGILHHSNCPQRIIKEAYRVLKPNGLIISSDPRKCLLTRLAKLVRKKSQYFSSMHQSFSIQEYREFFTPVFNISSFTQSLSLFFLLAQMCDALGLSKIMPLREIVAGAMYKIDCELSQSLRFLKRNNFIINVIARKETGDA